MSFSCHVTCRKVDTARLVHRVWRIGRSAFMSSGGGGEAHGRRAHGAELVIAVVIGHRISLRFQK